MAMSTDGQEQDKTFYATVGELVILSTILDDMLNTLLIETFQCGNAVWLPAIIATLDTARKIEILKGDVKMKSHVKISKPIRDFLDKVEAVTKQRNIVCHTPPSYENGSWGFRPTTAAKLLHPSNVYNPRMMQESLDKINGAIVTANAALQAGSELIEHYKRMYDELREYSKRINSKKRTQKHAKGSPP
jgi:hypothetical protein